MAFHCWRCVRLVAVGASLLLVACDQRAVVVDFAQPFPTQTPELSVFPARHRAVYTAADSTTSLCIGPRAVWRQQLRSIMLSRRQLDSLPQPLRADSTYRENGRLHYLRLMGRDSVRATWLESDTLFTLAGPDAGRLRRFRGCYYLNTPNEAGDGWWVQRLAIADRTLVWQTLGQDTLRLLALDPASVQNHRAKGVSSFRLVPAPGPQTRRVSRYAGLWETADEFARRR